MAVVRSVLPQKTCEDLWTILLKCFTPKAEYKPSKVHIVFDNYSDDQYYSVKETKRVGRGEGKRLYIGKDSQDMSQGEEIPKFPEIHLEQS